ncbi:hypothetical protein MRB53_015586 [Persea americana]|uniref:Uncharacterized protein n=1 Tax=Persea americana TaxID=3435 RepID=A0ACC2LZI9_PERAE|nr:hypothetical protein MRB53_015586 [Persea americana]
MERSCDVFWTLTQLCRCLHGRRTSIFQVSPTQKGGKLAIAALPLLSSAVNPHFQVSSAPRGANLETAFPGFLRSERRKSGNFRVTAVIIGGLTEVASGFKISRRPRFGPTTSGLTRAWARVLRRFLDTHAALPLPAWVANLHLPGFPNSERRKADNCSFTAALIGGKLAFPGFLRSERSKSGNCSLTAPLIGGKTAFPRFLRSERTKSGNFRVTAVIIGGLTEVASGFKISRRPGFGPTTSALPLLAWAASLHFPGFPNSERRKAGNCSFTAALIGGKPAFPGFLRSERSKSGNCSLTAAFIGGKTSFPSFLRSESRKSGNFKVTAVIIGGLTEVASGFKISRRPGFEPTTSGLTRAWARVRLIVQKWLLDIPRNGPASSINAPSLFYHSLALESVLRRFLDTHAALPLLAWAANLHFPGFHNLERRKAGNYSFTAALIGGKPAFPGFLRSERSKSGNCSLTAPLIGGKTAFPRFLRSERRKSGNFRVTAVIIGGLTEVASGFKISRRPGFGPTTSALPLLSWAANLQFPGFPNSERRKAGNCSFTAALIGGKPTFPGFLRSERSKSGNRSLTAALIGGKTAFPRFLRSERRKSGNFKVTAVIIGGKPAFSRFPPS